MLPLRLQTRLAWTGAVLLAGTLGTTCSVAEARAVAGADVRVLQVSTFASRTRSGETVGASALLHESGGARARAFVTGFHLSRDTRRSADDVALGRTRAATLRAGARKWTAADLRIPAGVPTGRYRLIACADATGALRERDERDNCAAARTVLTVSPGTPTSPAAVTTPTTPPAATAGGPPAAPGPASAATPPASPPAPAVPAPGADPSTPPEEPTVPRSPFAGVALHVDPDSAAAQQVAAWQAGRPADAASIAKIAGQPQAAWLGGWIGDVEAEVAARVRRATAQGAMAVFVAYDIPGRDCGSHSTGGAASSDAYRAWIRAIDAGLGDAPAAIVLEPDALAQLCAASGEHDGRLELLADAVAVLAARGRRAVYLDAGHAGWLPPDVMAARLRGAGIAGARGFSLNVSNFGTVAEETAYGEAVSARLGGTPFVIDTSRSGLGRTTLEDWCNPIGRALGRPPTADTGHPLLDALLWIKNPGESDGTCNGGPAAGEWWPDQALGLARRAPW